MEPERQIEKVLRTFARKRREQAGAPLELHPVDRRLLQDEVTRQTSKPKERRNFFLTWVTRPRLSFVLFVLALSAVGSWFVLPLLTTSKSKSMRVAQGNRSRAEEFTGEPRPAAAPARAPAESGSALKKETDQVAVDRERENKRKTETSDFDDRKQLTPATVTPTVASTSPVSGEKLAQAISNETQVAMFEQARDSAATNMLALADGNGLARASRVANKPALEAETAVNSPAGRVGGGGGAGFGGRASSPVRFQRIQNTPVSTATPVFTRTESLDTFSNSSAATRMVSNSTLLVSFDLEQNGQELRVIDRDGSVYKGSLQLADASAPGSPAVQLKQPTSTSASVRSDAALDKIDSDERSRGWSFRVSGTNLSLNQNIVFTGNLSVATNGDALASSTARAVNGNSAIPQTGDTLKTFLQNSRINGTVLIENTGKLEIIAAPAAR
jgi:hypothetical protein